jgi:XTP/dITP diphosphohydrolase
MGSGETPSADGVGALLFTAVALARAAGVDPEAALRGTARAFRERLAAAESAARAAGRDPRLLGEMGWRDLWAGP